RSIPRVTSWLIGVIVLSSLMVGSVRGRPSPSAQKHDVRLVASITGSRLQPPSISPPSRSGPRIGTVAPMHVDAPLVATSLAEVPAPARRVQADGFDGAYTFEVPRDPFLPLVLAAEHTERISLMTAVAIAFSRNPMTVSNTGWDLQARPRGPEALGLGSHHRA